MGLEGGRVLSFGSLPHPILLLRGLGTQYSSTSWREIRAFLGIGGQGERGSGQVL